MVRPLSRRCSAITQGGSQCDATPLREVEYCFWHSPDHQQEAAEARRLGGIRRKREGAVAGAFEFEGVSTIPQLRRLLEIAAVDTLALENSVARSRAIIGIVQVGARLVEVGDLEARLQMVEDAIGSRAGARAR